MVHTKCHCCGKLSATHKLCDGCHVGVYCGTSCQQKDAQAHAAYCDHSNPTKAAFWDTDHVELEVYDQIRSQRVRSLVEDALLADEPQISMPLKRDIAHDLHVNGKLFQTYMKSVLATAVGRRRVLEKLEEKGKRFKYLSAYREDQVDEIREIVESKKEDPNYDALNKFFKE